MITPTRPTQRQSARQCAQPGSRASRSCDAAKSLGIEVDFVSRSDSALRARRDQVEFEIDVARW